MTNSKTGQNNIPAELIGNPDMLITVDDLPIDTRSKNAFLVDGIFYLGQIVLMNRTELLRLPNMGVKGINMTIEALEALGHAIDTESGTTLEIPNEHKKPLTDAVYAARSRNRTTKLKLTNELTGPIRKLVCEAFGLDENTPAPTEKDVLARIATRKARHEADLAFGPLPDELTRSLSAEFLQEALNDPKVKEAETQGAAMVSEAQQKARDLRLQALRGVIAKRMDFGGNTPT